MRATVRLIYGTVFRLLLTGVVAGTLVLVTVSATRAVPPNGDTATGVGTRRDADVDYFCTGQGGTAEVTDYKSSAGDLVASTVSCTGAKGGDWTCTESLTQSSCQSALVAPTLPAFGAGAARAAVNAGVNAPVTAGQPTPTPLPPSLVDAIQNRTAAEMARCTRQGGTPTRTDVKAGDDLHAQLVQCTGGGLDGTVCAITSSGANCQQSNGSLSNQPVTKNPGGRPAPPQPTPHATTTLLPGATPVVATPAPSAGKPGGIGAIEVKPGPAKLPPINNSGIFVSAWTCPTTVNGTSDVDQLKAACKDLHNTDFVLSGTGIVTEYPKGDIAKSGLPAGQYTIRELIPNHYGLGQTYCTFVPTGSPPPAVWTAAYNEYDGYDEFALGDSQTVYCDWFNFLEVSYTPTPTPPGNTVTNVGVIKAQATAPAATPGT